MISAAAAATGRFVAGGFWSVYDGVIGPWLLDEFAVGTGLPALDYVILLPSVETCVERVTHRTGHGFDDEPAARKMHEQFVTAISQRHVLPVGSDTVDQVVDRIVAARATGRLRYASGANASTF